MSAKAFFVGLIMTLFGGFSFLVTWGIIENNFPFFIKIILDSMVPLWCLVITIVGILVMLFGSMMPSKNLR